MLDYKLVEALAKVVQEGGFERAARVLFLTQSAISQRVRQLEEQCGQVLLTRSAPPQPTAAGKALLKHYQQVSLLEHGLKSELTSGEEGPLPTVTIGINADSLFYWFIEALGPLFETMNLLFDLRVDDQEQTHHYLREGEVVGCVSTEAKPMQGCRVDPLGSMSYRMLATPEFSRRWFPQGLTEESVSCAPAVLFNRKDRLHQLFLEQQINMVGDAFPAHYLPAPEPFAQLIIKGYSYGMIPDWQGEELLKSGQLIELLPGAKVQVDLFWHCWNLSADPLLKLSEQLIEGARSILNGNNYRINK